MPQSAAPIFACANPGYHAEAEGCGVRLKRARYLPSRMKGHEHFAAIAQRSRESPGVCIRCGQAFTVCFSVENHFSAGGQLKHPSDV